VAPFCLIVVGGIFRLREEAVFDVFGEAFVGVRVVFLGRDELAQKRLPVFLVRLGEDALVEVDFPEQRDFVAEAGIDDALALIAEDGGIVQRDDDLLARMVAEVAAVATAQHGFHRLVKRFFVLHQFGLAAGIVRAQEAEAGDQFRRGGGEFEVDLFAFARQQNVVPLRREGAAGDVFFVGFAHDCCFLAGVRRRGKVGRGNPPV
jgi:hypothetical protein